MSLQQRLVRPKPKHNFSGKRIVRAFHASALLVELGASKMQWNVVDLVQQDKMTPMGDE